MTDQSLDRSEDKMVFVSMLDEFKNAIKWSLITLEMIQRIRAIVTNNPR